VLRVSQLCRRAKVWGLSYFYVRCVVSLSLCVCVCVCVCLVVKEVLVLRYSLRSRRVEINNFSS
jgi:hypothetical protein